MIGCKGLRGIFISNGKKGKDSKTTESLRDAEHCRERKIASAIK